MKLLLIHLDSQSIVIIEILLLESQVKNDNILKKSRTILTLHRCTPKKLFAKLSLQYYSSGDLIDPLNRAFYYNLVHAGGSVYMDINSLQSRAH